MKPARRTDGARAGTGGAPARVPPREAGAGDGPAKTVQSRVATRRAAASDGVGHRTAGKENDKNGKTLGSFVDRDLPRAFGRLTLLRHLARGGMGEVYLAAAGAIEGAERPCIVKIIRREHADDKSFLARFFDEARIQAQMHHPGVVQVLEASTDPTGKPFVVLEYVEGRNLSEIRHRSQQLKVRVDWSEAAAVGIALGEGLAHVHERTDACGKPLAVSHRDLSPQNVMVGYGGDVKVIDFGTARGENRRCRTVAGIVFAKPGYVAPEVANENPGGPPADLYAYGVMLWEIVAGRRFLTGDAQEHMAAVGKGDRHPTPLAALVGAPPELDAIIAKLTATRIEDRYRSAREAVRDLARLLGSAPSLANGDRGVRTRITQLMQRLYPSEPARSRAEFARLVATARDAAPSKAALPVASPSPAPAVVGANAEEMLPGTRYRVVREIARGEMGVVYEAFHVDLGRTVALKVLPKERAASEEAAERFRTEARALSKLRHEGIVELYDFGVSTNGQPYYAMELLEGETLGQYLYREKGMDWRESVRLAIQACRALEAAHDAGVVHRDITPGNLFLTSDGGLKLLDFGVAKSLAEPVAPEDGSPKSGLKLFGTAEYMAPEQIEDGNADARSDLYSLGAVLYELLTGRLPHVAPSTVALLDAKLHVQPERPRLRAPQRGLPRRLDDLVHRALHREPALRFQTAEEMRQELARTLREPIARRARRRAAAFAMLGLLGAGLAAAVSVSASDADVRARATGMAEPVVSWLSGLRPVDQSAPTLFASTLPRFEDLHLDDADAPEFVLQEAPEPESIASAEDADPVVDGASGSVDADDVAMSDDAEANDALAAVVEEVLGERDPSDSADAEVDTVAAALERAQARMLRNPVAGYAEISKLAKLHAEDARVLEAWSKAAEATTAWGDALRAARLWAATDEGIEAQLQLARMLRATGRGAEAVGHLEQITRDHPDAEAPRALLERLAPSRLAMGER